MILQSDKTSDNFSDRAILKNLGKWLGMQTVAKNRPILHVVWICPFTCTLKIPSYHMSSIWSGHEYQGLTVRRLLQGWAGTRVLRLHFTYLLACWLFLFQDLLYVVPFVAKVLEACADSKVCVCSVAYMYLNMYSYHILYMCWYIFGVKFSF